MEKKEQSTRPDIILEEEEEYFDNVPTGETDEFLLKNNTKDVSACRQTSIISTRAKILHLMLFSVSLTLFITALKIGYRPMKCETVKCSNRETVFTPEFALSDADRAKNSNIETAPVEHNDTTCHDPYVWCSYETRRFTDAVDSPYRVAGPEAEELWGIDTNAQPFGISQQVLDDIDGPVDAATMPQKMGGGYVASLAVHHQLHCVRILWQYSKFEYYKDVEPIFFESMDSIHQHLDHCADILRQVLMCHGDTSLITYTWWKGIRNGPGAVLNATMNLPRQCRNYDEIMRWSKHHEFKTIHLGDGM